MIYNRGRKIKTLPMAEELNFLQVSENKFDHYNVHGPSFALQMFSKGIFGLMA